MNKLDLDKVFDRLNFTAYKKFNNWYRLVSLYLRKYTNLPDVIIHYIVADFVLALYETSYLSWLITKVKFKLHAIHDHAQQDVDRYRLFQHTATLQQYTDFYCHLCINFNIHCKNYYLSAINACIVESDFLTNRGIIKRDTCEKTSRRIQKIYKEVDAKRKMQNRIMQVARVYYWRSINETQLEFKINPEKFNALCDIFQLEQDERQRVIEKLRLLF